MNTVKRTAAPGVGAAVDFLLILGDDQLSDLHSVGGCALSHLVAAAPQTDAAIIGEVGTDTAHEHQILAAGFQRHGILLILQIVHQLHTGSLGQHFSDLLHSYGNIEGGTKAPPYNADYWDV